MTPRIRFQRLILLSLVTIGVALSGCDAIRQSDFFSRHISNEDKNAVARKRWDSFRGNVRLQMAEQQLKSGRYDEAEKTLAEARGLVEDSPEVLRLSAELHYQKGELTRALTEIEEYMAIAPDDVLGRELGGRIASRAGRIDDAIMWYRSAVELAPEEAAYRLKLAECLMARGDSGEALSVIDRVSQFETSFPLRQLAMEICDARGDADGAARHARVVAQIGADDEAVQERAGVVLANARAYEDAVAVLKPVIDRYMNRGAADSESTSDTPARPKEAIQSFARSCIELNRDDEAMRVLKAAIRDDPSDQVTWSLYCRSAIRAGNLDMALEIVSTFNRRNKPIPEMLVLEAYVYFLRGDLARARETADQALKIDPGFEAAFILKAKASNDARSQPSPVPAKPRIRETLAAVETRRDAVVRYDEPSNTRQWYLYDPRAASRVAIAEEDDGR